MQKIMSLLCAAAIVFTSVISLFAPLDAVWYFDSVNGSDLNSGRSEAKPLRSLAMLNALALRRGDEVRIKRGSVYRGTLWCREDARYGAYGEGEKPLFLGSVDGTLGGWTGTAYENVWVFGRKLDRDVGCIFFDGGAAHGFKKIVGFLGFEGGAGSLDSDLAFWHGDDKKVYLYSETDPDERFEEIEMGIDKHVIKLADGVTLEDICVKYGGAHGMTGSKLEDVTIRGCEIGFLGGSLPVGKGRNRYGNGIEFWEEAKNVLVEDCFIYEIYDAGLTFQMSGKGGFFEDIVFRNNVVTRCTYGLEYFTGEGGLIRNVLIEGNEFSHAGEGWGAQRRDPVHTACINSWRSHENRAEDFVIAGNLIAWSTYQLYITESTAGTPPEMRDNVFEQYPGGMLTPTEKFR